MSNRKLSTLKALSKENGAGQLVLRSARAFAWHIRDRSIASRIGCAPLRLGKNPRIIGFHHLSVGRGFRAGDFLWLEAVTEYQGLSYQPHIGIGDRVIISDFVHIAAASRVEIGDDVLIGSKVLITDHNHGQYHGNEQSAPTEAPASRKLSGGKPVHIGRNVWLGDGVVVLAGASIGEGSIVGANSVVTGHVPPNCIAAGMPARPIRHYDRAQRVWTKEISTK